MPEPSPFRQTDLRTEVPPDVTVTGLSAPRFDGVNYFRQPTAPASSVEWKTPGPQFVQMEYQLYSPSQKVTGVLKLDGRILDQTTFPAGQFIPNVFAGAFVPAGAHRFTLEYTCQGQPCAAPLSQYWTRLGQLPSGNAVACQDAGLGVQRWWLNAPDSPLKITGAGPPYFDGVNFARRLNEPSFQLSWTSGQALNASMLIYGPQPFRVTTLAGKQVLSVQKGGGNRSVSPAVSLVGHEDQGTLTVQVECLKRPGQRTAETGLGCASLYLPQVAVLTAPPATAFQVGGAAVAALLLIAGLWRWLGPVPGRLA